MKKIAGIALLMVAAAACGKTRLVQDLSSVGPPSPTETSIPSTDGTQSTKQVTIYYLVYGPRRAFLAPERHRVATTPAIARAGLEELIHGSAQDPQHTTPFPKDAQINSVTIKAGLATVDWGASVLEANAGTETEGLGIQSIVWTLTEFPTVEKVRFTVEGKDHGAASNGRAIEDWWGHVGLGDQPFRRAPAIDVLAPITLWTPANGDHADGTLRLTGEASTFEANVGIFLRDAAGKTVVQGSTTAAEGAPGRGAFSKTITFTPPSSAQTWTLQVIEDSAKDGSIVFMEDRQIEVG